MASEPARSAGLSAQAAIDLAVAGSRPDVVAAMSASAGWTMTDLEPLMAAGLITLDRDHVLQFASEDARLLILKAAPTAARSDAHRRAARVGRDLRLPVRQIVDHLLASTPMADERVAEELVDVALLAEAEDDLRAAVAAWQEAARRSPRQEDRVDRAVRALRLIIVNGIDYAGAEGLLELLSGEQLTGECACWVDWVKALQRSEVAPDAALTAQWSTIRRASEASPETLRALLWDAAMNAWTLGDVEAGLRAAREYGEVERRWGTQPDDVEPPWTGAALLSAALFEAGEVPEAEELRDHAIAAARDVDPGHVPYDRLLSTVFLDDLLLDMGPQAGDRLQVCLQRSSADSAARACLLGIQAWRARARGDWAGALSLLHEGRPLAGVTGASGAQRGMSALAIELAALGGPVASLHEDAEEVRGRALARGDLRRVATVDRALGLRALCEGQLDEAVVRLRSAADVRFLGRRLRDGVLTARVDVVEALVRRGQLGEARTAADTAREVLTEMRDPLARALALRVEGLVHRGAPVTECYVEALAHHGESVDVFEQARTLLLLGEEERRSRRRTEARTHLLAARTLFVRLSATPWIIRASTELRACGGTVAEPAANVAALTAQEAAVARRAALGLTNREVADVLFLSPRTVEFHLGNVYRKLGIRGRAALAAHLAQATEAGGQDTALP